MNHLDVFTGIGGFTLAAQQVWGEELDTIAFCEIDPYCQAILKLRYKGVPIYEDIHDLIADTQGWAIRNKIIWHKPNCMPASTSDRYTVDFEEIFFMAKTDRYYHEQQIEPAKQSTIERLRRGISDHHKSLSGAPGQAPHTMHQPKPNDKNREVSTSRHPRAVWTVATQPCKKAHFATFPPKLISPMIKASCPPGGTVLDFFSGLATTGRVAVALGRNFIGIEINPEYHRLQCEQAWTQKEEQ